MCKTRTFDMMRIDFTDAVRISVRKTELDPILMLFDSMKEPPSEKRAALDQGFRDYLIILLCKPQDTTVWESLLMRCLEASQSDMSSVTLPVILLGDIFDCLTLNKCEELFTFVEDNVSIWKKDLFFTSCKNNLLRMCNDLLRRLSRTQNTVFCGRILLFLANFFPFSERSGLNIVSEFNVDNVTEFSSEDAAEILEEEKMDDSTIDVDDQKMKIDYNLYTKFWALQNFFRNPLLLYNNSLWKTFTTHTENILLAFKSFKLEGIQTKLVSAESMVKESIGREHYFAKYLTNIKLLELQLSDVNFRRYVLIQFLILFQYLNATVKFKSESQALKPEEVEWVKETTNQVYSLLKDTPPNGEEFTESIEHILKREEFWNSWKNDGCPELKKPPIPDEGDSVSKRRPKKRRLAEIVKEAHSKNKYCLGNPELTKLWNYNPDNLAQCRAPERNFLVSLDDYFKEAIEQLDPAAMVEAQYRIVNDGSFGWRALRLLALKSPHFFTPSNNPINTLPEYLEALIRRMAKDRPVILPSGEVKPQETLETTEANMVEVNETEAEGEPEGEAEEDDELLKNEESRDGMNNEDRSETPETTQKPKIAPAIFDVVAQTVNTQWQELADKMGFKDSIQYIEESMKTDVERARYVLQLCAEEDSDLGPLELAKSLETYGFPKAASAVIKIM